MERVYTILVMEPLWEDLSRGVSGTDLSVRWIMPVAEERMVWFSWELGLGGDKQGNWLGSTEDQERNHWPKLGQ